MLPYLQPPSLELPFGLRLEAFGLLSTLGTYVGAVLGARAARRYAPGDDSPLKEVAPWAIGFGLLGAHLLHVLGYHPEVLAEQGPVVLLKIWDGLSSMGGVLGALLGILVYFRRARRPVGPYLDALALGTAPGWAIARVGCFFAHDHPGVRTSFFLAVDYPGGPRHDLGLYDALVLAGISVVLYALARKRRPQGFLLGLLAVLYSLCRFFFDFLRASDLSFVDKRYLGLTPAQFIVGGLFAGGVYLLVRARAQATPVGR